MEPVPVDPPAHVKALEERLSAAIQDAVLWRAAYLTLQASYDKLAAEKQP